MASELEVTPRRRPRQSRSKATVDAIMGATAEVLVGRGYDKASTNLIAKRAGVSIGSLYQYYPNKESLVAALCERHMTESFAMIVDELAALRSKPLEQAVPELIAALLRLHTNDPDLHRVFLQELPRIQGLEPLQHINRLVEGAVRAALELRRDDIRPADLDMATFILVHSVQAVTHAAVLRRPDALADASLASEIAELVLRYLKRS
jgi:AcrR family transcriptional regulator